MPEISEMRLDADSLNFILNGRQLTSITLLNPDFAHKVTGLEELATDLPLTIEWVKSRAKKIFIKLNNANGKVWYIFITYIMTGGISCHKSEYDHLRFTVSDHWIGFNTFYFHDTRKFGSILMSADPKVYQEQVTDMAKPFLGYENDPDFEPISKDEFVENIHNCKNSALVPKLMDQRSIGSGIGRYLLSDILYHANIDPWIKCSQMTAEMMDVMWKSIHYIINLSYDLGGNSIRDYKNIDGTAGTYWDRRLVYGREGEEDDAGEIIKREKGPGGIVVHYVDSQLM